jgi:hypothetical protein
LVLIKVLVLYLDRPLSGSGCDTAHERAVQIQRLEGSAFSEAADLWALNRLELLLVGSGPEVRVCRVGLSKGLMAAYELRIVVEACRQAKPEAGKGA